MNTIRATPARRLFEVGSVQFGAFRLKLHENTPDAPLSPIFLNLRTADNPKPGPLTRELVDEIGAHLYKLAVDHALTFTHVAGVPRAGDPFAETLSTTAERVGKFVQILHLNKEETGSGRRVGTQISGDYKAGDKVLLVDDLITKAESKLEAIAALEQAGLKVVGVVVLVDREQGGAKQLREAGYKLLAVFTLSELLDYYVDIGAISGTKREEVKTYLAENS